MKRWCGGCCSRSLKLAVRGGGTPAPESVRVRGGGTPAPFLVGVCWVFGVGGLDITFPRGMVVGTSPSVHQSIGPSVLLCIVRLCVHFVTSGCRRDIVGDDFLCLICRGYLHCCLHKMHGSLGFGEGIVGIHLVL